MASKYAEKLQSTIQGSGLATANALLEKLWGMLAAEAKKTKDWDAARENFASFGNAKIEDMKIVVAGHVFSAAEIFQEVEDMYVRRFDTHVAEAVKDVVFEGKLTDVSNALSDLSYRVDNLKEELNGEVGRKIEAVLGPNAFWSESSGTC